MIRPLLTEKSTGQVAAKNIYMFLATMNENKKSAAKKIKELYTVNVTDIKVVNRLGKSKNIGKRVRRSYKLADRKVFYVKLGKDEKIADFTVNS